MKSCINEDELRIKRWKLKIGQFCMLIGLGLPIGSVLIPTLMYGYDYALYYLIFEKPPYWGLIELLWAIPNVILIIIGLKLSYQAIPPRDPNTSVSCSHPSPQRFVVLFLDNSLMWLLIVAAITIASLVIAGAWNFIMWFIS